MIRWGALIGALFCGFTASIRWGHWPPADVYLVFMCGWYGGEFVNSLDKAWKRARHRAWIAERDGRRGKSSP